MADTFDIIQNAVNEARENDTFPPETDSEVSTDQTPTEDVVASPEASSTDLEASMEAVSDSTDQVPSPGSKEEPKPEDEFAKLIGIPAESAPGRENRIPYSRVKKITETAVRKERERLEKEHKNKLDGYVPYEEKAKSYDALAQKVANYEHVLENQPEQFLTLLSQHPVYAKWFEAVRSAFEFQQAGGQQPTQPVEPNEEMPRPGADGLYDDEGLKNLLAWHGRQVEQSVSKSYDAKLAELTNRYKPIEDEWTAYQRYQAMVPAIQAQLEQGRKYDKFTEHENDMAAAMQANPNLTLDGAWAQVVYPKIKADYEAKLAAATAEYEKVRKQVLAELKKAPVASSVPARVTKPEQEAPAGRSTEQIILDEMEKAGLRF